MLKRHVSEKIVTTIIGMLMVWGAIAYMKSRRQKLNREIDEFDRIMRELKMNAATQYKH